MGIFKPEVECASRDEMRAIQSERLKKMVKNAYENVPFYKQKLDEAGVAPDDVKSIDDITRLPFTVKTDLRDNYPFGLFAVPNSELVRVHASSGTTGKQTVVGYTKNDINVWSESAARAIAATGGSKDDIVHVSYGYGLFTGGLGLHYGAEYLGATAIPVSTGNTARQLQIFQDFGSTVLCCTPSYAMYLGEYRRDNNIPLENLKLRAGIFGAEPWTDEMRRKIEELLGIEAYDIYGLSEIAGPGVSFDCEMHNGLHINEDYFYPEVIDPEEVSKMFMSEFYVL
jgi:phenylacetate-CoA ligase